MNFVVNIKIILLKTLLPAIPATINSINLASESPPQQLHDRHREQTHRHLIV